VPAPPPMMRPPPLASTATPPGHRRVRVSVRTSVRDSSLLVVRPLAEGDAPPTGTREAYLVMAHEDHEVDAFDSNRKTAP
jgi:hypothetical protein